MRSINSIVFVAIVSMAFLGGCGLQDLETDGLPCDTCDGGADGDSDCDSGTGPTCGDGLCEGTENPTNCPEDCVVPPGCGNGVCDADENCRLCEDDCGSCPSYCGDGECNGSETCSTCSADCGACPPICGDGNCDQGECGWCRDCDNVCPPVCGDGTCEGGETCSNCSEDCGACPPTCGDGECNGSETCGTCSEDCGSCCGNGVCGAGESCCNCEADCGACPTCGDGTCNGSETYNTCPCDCPLPAPFEHPAACTFNFSSYYIEGATEGVVLGALAHHNWNPSTSPIRIVDEDDGVLDGWLGYSVPVGFYAEGYYRSTFYGWNGGSGDWSDHGHPEHMAFMTSEALEWICCSYKDATGALITNPANYRWCDGTSSGGVAACDIFFHLDEDCNATPAGNAHLVDWQAVEGITCGG